MQKLALLLMLTLLTGCIFPGVYKINVQQGKILDEEQLTKLDKGMPRNQIHAILGDPVMLNPVDESREYYNYSFQKSGGEIRKQRVIVYYDGDTYSYYEAKLLEDTPAY